MIMSKQICGICAGKCCKDGGPAVSLKELNKLVNPIAKQIKDDLYRLTEVPCQYLSDTGCTLEEKPLACILYPFYPTADGLTSHKKMSKTWVVKTSCPYWYEFKEEDLLEVQLSFEEKREEFKTPLQALPYGYEHK